MEMSQSSQRMHPLVAGAAASVMLVSLLGAAAITGILPTSHGSEQHAAPATLAPAPVAAAPAPAPAMQTAAAADVKEAPAAAVAESAPHAAPARVVHHVVYRDRPAPARTQQPAMYAQADTSRQAAPVYTQPAPAPAPAAQPNSPVGIGVGAVVGGLLGNQVGGGNGRTLATIAGAVGGGYLGNEIAKRAP